MKTTQIDEIVQYTEVDGIHFLSDTPRRKLTAAGIQVFFLNGGSYYDKVPGMAHILEHAKLAAGNHTSTNLFEQDLAEKASSRNGSTSPITWDGYMRGPRHYSSFLWETLKGLTTETVLQQHLVTQEQQIVAQEIIRAKGSKSYQLEEVINKALYKEKSYLLTDVLGAAEDIRAATLHDLQERELQLYNESNVIVVMHNIDEAVHDQVIADMASWKARVGNQPPHAVDFDEYCELQDFKVLPIVDDRAHDNVNLRVVLPFPVTFDNFGLRVALLKFALNGGSLSKLYRRLRDELGVIYALSADFDRELQLVTISCTCGLEYVEKIVNEIKDFLENQVGLAEYTRNEPKLQSLKDANALSVDMGDESDVWGRLYRAKSELCTWNQFRPYSSYKDILQSVQGQDIENALSQLSANWKDVRIFATSSDKKLKGTLESLNLKA